ncbi:LysR family transcriptional regulator [Cobetia marina]
MRPIHDTLDWNLLRTFIVIVQEESVSRAAARLYLSQPAVSLSLKRLEERLGQRLIERDSHSFRVTGAGQVVYREAVEIYANVARLASEVGNSHTEISGHVSLLFITGIECRFLDSVFARFHRCFPKSPSRSRRCPVTRCSRGCCSARARWASAWRSRHRSH